MHGVRWSNRDRSYVVILFILTMYIALKQHWVYDMYAIHCLYLTRGYILISCCNVDTRYYATACRWCNGRPYKDLVDLFMENSFILKTATYSSDRFFTHLTHTYRCGGPVGMRPHQHGDRCRSQRIVSGNLFVEVYYVTTDMYISSSHTISY